MFMTIFYIMKLAYADRMLCFANIHIGYIWRWWNDHWMKKWKLSFLFSFYVPHWEIDEILINFYQFFKVFNEKFLFKQKPVWHDQHLSGKFSSFTSSDILKRKQNKIVFTQCCFELLLDIDLHPFSIHFMESRASTGKA